MDQYQQDRASGDIEFLPEEEAGLLTDSELDVVTGGAPAGLTTVFAVGGLSVTIWATKETYGVSSTLCTCKK